MGLEYMCQNCEIRLDPHMTKHECDYFLKAGCPICHHNSWVLVEGTYQKFIENSDVVAVIETEDETDEEGKPTSNDQT